MGRLIDLTGQRFGRLVVLSRSAPPYWLCRCDCGTTRDVTGPGLRGGLANSCGCLRGERLASARRSHGLSNTRVQRIWSDMRRRCSDPGRRDYPHYGGRGIKVCERWDASLSAFVADMGEPPSGLTLDRIDPNGDYEPGNCRWASAREQMRNQRRTLWVDWRGARVGLAVVAEATRQPYESLRRLVNLGWSAADAVAHVTAHPYLSRGRARRPKRPTAPHTCAEAGSSR